jgi:putative transposase
VSYGNESEERDGWWIGRYILMPDHVHFFARRATIAQPMAKWMQMWKSVSSRELAAVLDITPPIWQPDYFDRYLRSRENYGQKWNYVEQNALRAGLIREGEQWPCRGSIFDLMW